MKKIFGFLIICLFVISCDDRPNGYNCEGDTKGTELITLTVNGKSHEFVKYSMGCGDCSIMGISHWPECKHCKKIKDNYGI